MVFKVLGWVFMVSGGFLWLFKVPGRFSWFFIVLSQFLWFFKAGGGFFKIPGRFFVVFHDSRLFFMVPG